METVFQKQPRIASASAAKIDLSAKLERLKRGLIADTVKIPSRQYPSLKSSRLAYGLKSGRFGAFDPLRKRSKKFRQAVGRYSPPYYFWHKEYLSRKKFKPLVKEEEFEPDGMDNTDPEHCIQCQWCEMSVRSIDYEKHKLNKCSKRYDFYGIGYYGCNLCNEGFLDSKLSKEHLALHYPNRAIINNSSHRELNNQTVGHSIICRDHSKRKKWL